MTNCTEGPAAAAEGEVLVSITDFTRDHLLDTPGIVAAGVRLRLGWYAMRGSVGLWLWSIPLSRRSGSISVWESEDDLRSFVALPKHIAIMRHYRERGTLRSTTWVAERFNHAEVLDGAVAWITDSAR